MKKILFIKPKDKYFYAVIPNLGLGYLASILVSEGHHVDILDCNKCADSEAEFDQYVRKNEYDVFGFQVYTSGIVNAAVMMKKARQSYPGALIIAGGPHPSGDPADTYESLPDTDLVVVGESEKVIAKITGLSRKDLKNYDLLAKIDNIVYRGANGNLVYNKVKFIEDLDTLSFPRWELIDPGSYPMSPHGTFSRAYPTAPIITSRGCPYPCTFCTVSKIFGKRIRQRSVKNVLDEMECLDKKYGIKEFHIEDDNFTIKKDYVLEFCRGISERGLNIWWACPNGIRADKIDKEMLKAMEKSGCYSFAFGIESGSKRVLKKMNKSITLDEIEKKVSMVKKLTKIQVTGFFLIGYPGETVEDLEQTLSFSRKLKLDKASFSPVMPLPGSSIYNDWKKNINTERIEWDKFLYYQIVPGVSDIDENLLAAYLKKAFIGFYLRPRIIAETLIQVKTIHQLKALLKRIKTVLFK
ncbi:MAG: B12-binding domain-containing radical SAM protein [Candidatus Omnitrophica bacterium]|nr:B12-binding domain-containing radical SAM protein [Candidatus Omnitrophota bacterium]